MAAWLAGSGAAPAQEAGSLDIGGPFALVDHQGNAVTDRDFRGRFMLLFFGYANCPGVCPIGLRHMTEALDLLGAAGAAVAPCPPAVGVRGSGAEDVPEDARAAVEAEAAMPAVFAKAGRLGRAAAGI